MLEIYEKNGMKPINKGTYPVDYRKIGEGEEDFKIFISDFVLNDIKAFLSSDKEKELGGVLLGEVYADDEGKNFVLLNEFVIALYTESNITRLTFTHSSWEYMNNKIDKEYPGKKILGWFHSHPGHTVFLSSYDKFIHENFFSQDFCVAYVYDPIHNDDGFFYKKDNVLVKAGCYYIYSQFMKSIGNQTYPYEEPKKEKKTIKSNLFFYLIFILALLILIVSVKLATKYTEISKKDAEIQDLSNRIKELKDENTKINQRLESISRSLPQDNDSIVNTPNIIKHQVKPGETLRSIAINYFKDEGKYNLLIRHNKLKDEYDIAVGQVIEIPPEK